jgi:hypothetical protein
VVGNDFIVEKRVFLQFCPDKCRYKDVVSLLLQSGIC